VASYIRPNRTEVSRTYPVLGFTIRPGITPAWVEIVLTTDPALLDRENRAHRTPQTFASSGADGLLPVTGDESVYLVPATVLGRFDAGRQLYYAMAVYSSPQGQDPTLLRMPQSAQPITLSPSFATVLRRPRAGVAAAAVGVPADPRSLEWSGDRVVPATTPAPSAVRCVGRARPLARHAVRSAARSRARDRPPRGRPGDPAHRLPGQRVGLERLHGAGLGSNR
jgi:hypothetical protein